MKSKCKLLFMGMIISVGFLAGCNANNDDNTDTENNDTQNPENVNYRPAQYDDETNTDEINEDNIRDQKPGIHEENPQETDMELQKGSNREFDKDRGAE